jgi:hypothetical protein
MLTAEEAIERWARQKLESRYKYNFDKVTAEFEMDPGYACCGGTDPNCYCSFQESPSFDVLINGHYTETRTRKSKVTETNRTVQMREDLTWGNTLQGLFAEILAAGREG